MIKVRIQGTPEEMEWLMSQLRNLKQLQIISLSETFSNKGTHRFFRRYFEIEKKSK